ncbi:hypothetical protein CN168_27745 [Sinorhizobium medicae]|nr:hypothetical protein CN168_27745 [Sinorhizobium medicae]
MTLFSEAAAEDGERFRLALERFFADEPDHRSLPSRHLSEARLTAPPRHGQTHPARHRRA